MCHCQRFQELSILDGTKANILKKIKLNRSTAMDENPVNSIEHNYVHRKIYSVWLICCREKC
jgi:hypothetical protein